MGVVESIQHFRKSRLMMKLVQTSVHTLQKVFAARYARCFVRFAVKAVSLTRSYKSYVIRLHTEATIKPIWPPNIFSTIPSHKLVT